MSKRIKILRILTIQIWRSKELDVYFVKTKKIVLMMIKSSGK